MAVEYRKRGRPTPPPPHPIDVAAAAIRVSETPRQHMAEAIDDLLGEWQMEGLAAPAVTFLEWVRTLAYACDAREKELGLGLRRVPTAEPWRATQ